MTPRIETRMRRREALRILGGTAAGTLLSPLLFSGRAHAQGPVPRPERLVIVHHSQGTVLPMFVPTGGAEDFELLINALASQSRVQVLSNPSVMVENNSEGFIQVGETIRLPSGVSFSSAGQQSSVTPEDIGIILTVKPSINPEGFVRMQIEPEISRLSLQTTQISENFNSPVVTRRRATTTVTVKDGQTVVIGGLISDRFERVDKKIPLLGDIPLVGALFRQYKENSSKTELLIVLTPHVVRSPTEGGGTRAADLTEEGVQRLSLPPALLEQIRKGQLEGKGQFEDGKQPEPTTRPDAGVRAAPAQPDAGASAAVGSVERKPS